MSGVPRGAMGSAGGFRGGLPGVCAIPSGSLAPFGLAFRIVATPKFNDKCCFDPFRYGSQLRFDRFRYGSQL